MESCRTSRRSGNRYGGSITLALRHALESIDDEFTQHAPKEPVPEGVASLCEIFKVLLINGANLFAANYDGRGMMHFTSERFAQELLIDHARRLEEKGLSVSVQRLLRITNTRGQTPLDAAKPGDVPYLEDELSQAVQRDSRVMYDFEFIDIPALNSGAMTRDDLLKYLLIQNDWTDPDYENVAFHGALRQYREWLAGRTLELKKQYMSRQREVTRGIHIGALEFKLPDEWDETEVRAEESD
jgi:hypothetical protein